MTSYLNQEIEKGEWSFLVYSSPLPFMFLGIAVHTWIVTISPDSSTHRYEVHFFKNKNGNHLYIDYQEPDTGLGKFVRNKNPKYKAKLLIKISGNDNSLAQKIVKFVENNIEDYKFKNKYFHIPGPNCNTLTQRVLDNFPEIKVKLPWNAFGKNYKVK